MFRMREVRIIW